MPRQPRVDAPGLAHHVMFRGIEKSRIFVDEIDERDLVRRLARLIPELGFTCYGWVFMGNHAHLVLRTGRVPLSRLMARVGTGYARRFNERHGRVGHLFQNRFRSRLILDDVDLMGVVLYVLRNPLRSGLVADASELESYDACAYGALLGVREPYAFEAVEEARLLFASAPAEAIRRIRRRIGDADDTVSPWSPPAPRATPRRHAARDDVPRPPLDAVIAQLCAEAGCPRAVPLGRHRVATQLRAWIAQRAVAELGYSSRELARALGVSDSSVHRALARAGSLPEPAFRNGNNGKNVPTGVASPRELVDGVN